MSIHDHAQVRQQYATEANLETRLLVWHPTVDGRDPATEALGVVVAARPVSVLDIGCGTGGFAARIAAALPDAAVVAIDQSERFVDLTASRGVEARVADVQDLAFDDESFDVVTAMWMLYHVPDLHLGLSEVRRVLRPGGTFVAVTNGDEHVADLRRAAGGDAVHTHFSSENGENALLHHFEHVEQTDLRTRAIFTDHATTLAYLASSQEDVEWRLPYFDGPREYAGHATIFVAR